jgi:hypothetical protein
MIAPSIVVEQRELAKPARLVAGDSGTPFFTR